MKRRSFIAGSAVLAASGAGTAGNVYAQAAKPAPAPAVAGSINSTESVPGGENWNNERSIPPEREKLLRIGGVFGLWSHMSSTWWRYLNPPEGYARTTGMRITHLWCVDREAGKRLAARYNATLVDRYDAMTGLVDGMYIDDFLATPLMPDLALPYLDAGIPCFFDRPMASSMAGTHKVLAAAKRKNTPFMVPSAYEYLKEIEVAAFRMNDIGDMTFYEARSSGTTMYQYALHGLWFTLRAMGVDVERIGHRAEKPVDAPSLTALEHVRGGRRIYGTIHHNPMRTMMCAVKAYGNKGEFEVGATTDGRPWYRYVFTYLEMCHAFERMIRTRQMPQTYDYIEAKMRVFLSLLHSQMEKNGALMEVAALPETWDAGFPKGYRNSYSEEIIANYRAALKK